ncbi:DUF3782 domain-containing protein [Phormidium sp. FACHB-1136]|jgi:hypothetical protein|uniref:DUF3782 domain-containing protein n=1 Tax=Phormidium sp. FACHB-1136 TaxID=2692848 RepID=UPI0016862B49|nr:DUF3782 domain-containing protein [Phormidium sp. FACHB-1136]MBD2426999.1 DUF3782 domain-containing protein [Phormidium sp. FACHB-1136]
MATTSEEVWRILGELAEAQKETARQAQENARQAQESERRLERRFLETDQRLLETDQRIEQRFRETERLLRRQNQQLNEQLGKLGNRLGEFVEWQVRPVVVRLFQERGIAVHEFYPGASARRGNEGIEIDLLVVNSTEAILVEVKSKLTQADVDDHLERLSKFKRLMPRYGNVRTMGAVAGMVVPDEVARYAYRQGLFVMAQSGDNVVILNDATFQPRHW